MRSMCLLLIAAGGAAASASTFDVHSDVGAWAAALGNGGLFDTETFDSAARGYYHASPLANPASTFGGYIGGGPSDSDRTTYAGASLSGVGTLGETWTITSHNPTASKGVFFILDNPNDKNDVDNHQGLAPSTSGYDVPSTNQYLSFYNAGTSLTISFDPGDAYNSFAFDSFDLSEGVVQISWLDGSVQTLNLAQSGFDTFFGITGASALQSITILSVGNQGIAIDNMRFAQAAIVPAPAAAGLGLVGLTGLAVRRRR